MLLSLSVKNLALIDSVQMDFCAGFNVLTGETGAGKSIIVDSLKLALGAKNERELLGRGKKRASVEAVFGVKDNARVHAFLAQQQLPDEEDTLGLSREINESGRSVCRINGVLVASSIVKQLSAYLIDIYGQHDHQSLLNSASHLQFLDASDETGKIAEMTAELGGRYRKIAAMRARLRENLIDPRERERQLDILRFQRDEIDRMNLKEGEEEELTRQREKLVAGEQIARNLSEAFASVSGGENCATDAVSDAADAMADIAKYDEEYDALSKELSDILYRLEDAARSLREASFAVEYDDEALQRIEERLEDIFSLKRKYGSDIEQILKFRDEAASRIEQLENGAEDALKLEKEIEAETREYYALACSCSELRRAAAKQLEEKLLEQLRELGMEKTCFRVAFEELPSVEGCAEKMMPQGLDKITFLISPNPGMELKPLSKTVSGGELSRLMLALKTICANDGGAPSMVFDEIDSGIGGTTAWVIGRKMAAIAKEKQVLCVTHLAPVAALANGHWNVGKKTVGGDTTTLVTALDDAGRTAEIARMLGGREGEETYLTHAREMIAQAKREA